jgi:hypothetical protein
MDSISDTLHRFWKKEHDWGWKKFMELSKLHDGFIVEDVLTIKAQVQVIRYLFSLRLTFNMSTNYFQVASICLLCITMLLLHSNI